MSLFPAYAPDLGDNITANEGDCVNKFPPECNTTSLSTYGAVEEPSSESLALEAQLLASDNDDERDVAAGGAPGASRDLPEQTDYYLDQKLDVGNLRVSTLYYPGRPQYESRAPRSALGGGARGPRTAERARRYYAAPAPAPDERADAELAQRTKAFRDMLAENPTDEVLWLQFIEFQERWREADAALAAASAAAARLRGSARVRAALWRARDLALAPHTRLDLLRQDIAAAAGGADATVLTELWLRVLADAGISELDAAAAAALGATRACPRAYPHVLYAYGAALRAAGLWERLVLLLELVLSMNFPPAAFPPPRAPEHEQEQERQLQLFEDKVEVAGSGLPLSTVWVRVERARAAAHWRAASSPAGAPHDPQRAPQAADVADLLRPAAGPAAAALLLVNALRLAKVPLLPCAQYVLRAADGANELLGDAHEAATAELLPALLRAARRLHPAHPAHPAHTPAARLVAMLLEPPHYFTDDAGYLSWVTALWDAACEWLTGERRVALLCWRLRWLHSLLLLLDLQEETGRKEARRVRGEARAALKRFAGTSPQPFAHFARIEHAAGAPDAARRTALHALRAALRAPACAPHERLYVARVLAELCGDDAPTAWATACAALGCALPPDEQLSAPPPPSLLARALAACEARCSAAEREEAQDSACALVAGLAGEAEWAAARARLAPPARRAELVARLRSLPPTDSAAAARYREQSACALVLASAREQRMAQYARALAPLFPHNALLALAHSGAPLWAWERGAGLGERLRALAPPRSHRAALAHALPALLRAAADDWAGGAAQRAERACARAGRGGAGGALLHALRLESAARASRPEPALYGALAAHARHKWLAVRGAALVAAQAPALADVLLEHELRAHALLDELAPPAAR